MCFVIAAAFGLWGLRRTADLGRSLNFKYYYKSRILSTRQRHMWFHKLPVSKDKLAIFHKMKGEIELL